MSEKLEFLKNRRSFLRWIETVASCTTRDYSRWEGGRKPPLEVTVPEPEEYPCWAFSVVASFGYEEERPVYVYRRDLQRMLDRL